MALFPPPYCFPTALNPYLNIINLLDIQLSHDALYFVRFIPLARGALALSIVIGYVSSNAVASMFMSYLSIMLMLGYFCSLIFYQREAGVNPQVNSLLDSLVVVGHEPRHGWMQHIPRHGSR